MTKETQKNWLNIKHDNATGIETLRAHFEGHAYDPHWHDSYIIGVTDSGVQQFNCRHKTHRSLEGGAFLLEPGEIHDGNAPFDGGFTYRTLYLPTDWVHQQLSNLFETLPDNYELNFQKTLTTDKQLAASVSAAFSAKHHLDPNIVQEGCLDHMIAMLTSHMNWRKNKAPLKGLHLAYRIRDYLHDNMECDILIQDISTEMGYDRYHLTRAFKNTFGISPHAYLIQLRLAKARLLLAKGHTPANVAHRFCFADQSHLGRWFKRAYRLSPAAYRKICTHIPDPER